MAKRVTRWGGGQRDLSGEYQPLFRHELATPWAFFAVRAHPHGAPRWILLEGQAGRVVPDLEDVTTHLKALLAEDPPATLLDEDCEHGLALFLKTATQGEARLIPRRLQRALSQMHKKPRHWSHADRLAHDYDRADRWEMIPLLAAAGEDDNHVDLCQVAARWLQLVHNLRELARRLQRHPRYSKISDIDPLLQEPPLQRSDVKARLDQLQALKPFHHRVSACILAAPNRERDMAPSTAPRGKVTS